MKEEKGTAAVLPEETAMATTERPVTLIKPLVSPDDLIQHHRDVTDLIGRALTKGQDYGVIPGTGTKPTLLKPGAERIAIAFGCVPEYTVAESEIDHDRTVEWKKRKKKWANKFKGDRSFDWIEESGTSIGLYRYVVRCDLRQSQTGRLVASGIGTCSTMESKYIDRPRDVENTVVKMAQKRALVAAVLNAFGLSDRFTQDVEDMDHHVSDNGGSKSAADKPDNGKTGTSPMTKLYIDAKDAGVDTDTWKAWCKDIGVTKDARTHTVKRLADIEDRIKDWSIIGSGEMPEDKPSDRPKAKRGKNRLVTAEQIEEIFVAGKAKDLFSADTGMLLYVNDLLKTEMRSADSMTVGEYEQVLKEIDRSGPPAKDAGRDLPTAVARLKETLDANDLIAGENGFVGAVNFLTRHVNQPEIADEEEITFELIGMVGDGLERWQAEQDGES